MRRTVMALALVSALAPVSGQAAPTTAKGAYATLETATKTADIRVEEVATLNGNARRTAALTLSGDQLDGTYTCTYTWSGDAVLTGSATLTATCDPYRVVATFTTTGGGAFDIPLVCGVDFSRHTETVVRISRDGDTVVSGTTSDSRVWTNTDLDTCED